MNKYCVFFLVLLSTAALVFLPTGFSHAGIAGKDPACVRNCGTELASCLSPCRSGRNCPRECLSDPANYASCISLCEDEIQLCEGLCKEYNDSCIDSCPEIPQNDSNR